MKCFKNEYTFPAHTLRIAFGILFVMVAIKKFRMDGSVSGFAESLTGGDGRLANEIPNILLMAYGYALAIAELIAGVLLLLNKYTREAYMAIAVMYFTFIFGQMYDGNTGKIGNEYIPALVALVLASFFEEKSKKA